MRKMTLVAVACSLLLAAAAPLAAQTPSDAWQIKVVPYFLGAAITGTTAVAGQEATIDASFSDILKNLQFGAMGLVVARKGNWGFGGDALWMALGGNGTGPAGMLSASVDVNQGGFAFYGIRRLNAVADLTFGARVNTLQTNLRVVGPAAVRSLDGSKTWVDPLVGLILHTPERGSKWHAQVYTEIGGFGAGSKFEWQIFPTVGIDVSKRMSLEFGYRWLDMNYESGQDLTFFKYDTLTQGAVMGFAFRF